MSSFEPLSTNLSGRLKKINLSQSDCLLPIFECVVNSIQSIEERAEQDENFKIAEGRITVEFVYDESQLPIEEGSSCPVVGFRVTDNGCGFNTKNFNSFKTFDSEYKAAKGCKGVGRLQWLKEFDEAMITSTFLEQGKPQTNNFRFTKDGIELIHAVQQTTQTYSTTVFLKNLQKPYFDKVQQQSADFAGHLLNHIIWYYLDPERHPQILVKTKGLTLDLSNKFNEINEKDISRGSFTENGIDFTIYHLKIRNNGINQALLSLAANNRAVKQKNVRSSLGISQTLKDQNGDFSYLAFVTSSYLDSIVNSDRTELNFAQSSSEASLFSSEITEKDFNNAVMAQVKEFLKELIEKEEQLKKERLYEFINSNPSYRFLLNENRVSEQDLVDFDLKDGEAAVENHLFTLKSEFIRKNNQRGVQLKLANFQTEQEYEDYQNKLKEYLLDLKDINQSTLAEYVVHRRVIIDLLAKNIGRQEDGKFPKESVIHRLVFPMKKTYADALPGEDNLWLIDERLSFSSYLASDLPLKDMPVTDSNSSKRPDLLSCFDRPFLLSDRQYSPFTSFTIIEFKRPMRSDAAADKDHDPIMQILSYVSVLKQNKLTTPNGRIINAQNCPIYCYLIADLTPQLRDICTDQHDFTLTADGNGFFGFRKNINCFFTVMSYDGLLQSAKERNQAFFDKLGVSN